jgi:hypothetical protein
LRTLTASDAGDANSQVANNPTVVKQPEASLLLQQQIPGAVTPPVSSGKVSIFGRRIALIIGNGNYKNVPVLSNPQRDAMLVADALKRTGFQTVTMQTDLGRDALILALRNFAQEAESADWSVVYYSGHGMEVGGVNYLIPIDAKLATDRDIGFEAVPLDQILNAAALYVMVWNVRFGQLVRDVTYVSGASRLTTPSY